MTAHIIRRGLPGALLGLALALLLSGCGGPAAQADRPAADSPTVDAPASGSPAAPESSGPESPAPQDDNPFQAGTWLSDRGQYYFFDPDGAAGRTASLEDGTGVPFSYTLEGDQAAFTLGAADAAETCTVTQGQDGVLTLQWADGTAETLTHVSPLGSDQFVFYTNQELRQMALDYWQAHGDGDQGRQLTAACALNEDGTVTIQVYENLGDHNSTAAWYTVERTTAQGTDGAGQPVDLKA